MRVEQEKAVSTAEQHDTAETKDVRLAQQATQDEHALTFLGAMRKYWKAAMWSMLLSTSIVMEGYDIVLVSSFYAQPAFTRRYGEYDPGSDSYQISSSWQSGFNGAISIGTIIGAFANGYFTYRWGYRKVLLVSLGLIAAFIFMTFFAPNLGVLLAGELLCGIPWGVFATMGPAYASEVCPLALRGYLAVYVNLCWAFGQLISAGVQSGFSTNDTEWAYRAPFAIQWVWPIPLFVVLWFAPESPWHHVRRGEYAEAEQMITRLSNGSQQLHSKETLAMMIHTNDLERSMDAGTSYLDCFRGIDRRRTEIACMAFAAQPFCGSAIAGTPTYFFVQAGIATSISFTLSVGGLGLASVGTILSWFLMGRFGRRTLYLWGLGLLSLILFTVGFVSVGQGGSQAGNYAQAALMLLWLLVYYMTVGPICYAIIGESSSTRLRNKSVCLSRIAYYIAQVISNVISPQMLNPTAGNWKGKTGFFWGGCAALFFVWTFFRLPESKDRTFEELDLLYAKGISARHFSSYKVDAYVEGGEAVVKED